MNIAVSDYQSPDFYLSLATSDEKLIRLSINRRSDELKQDLQSSFKEVEFTKGSKALTDCINWLDSYFSGNIPKLLPNIQLFGTEFQKKVWTKLAEVPFGRLVTYGDLAEMVNCRSARPIGGAVGKNPISIIIPCHRVVASGMKLGGFSCGTQFKQKLLNHEGFVCLKGNKLKRK